MSQTTPERALKLEGGRNFRDFGGYEGADGRTVRWRMLFRSGALHALTEADFEALRPHAIKAVFDFRAIHEREREPTLFPAPGEPAIIAHDYDMSTLAGSASSLREAASVDDAIARFAGLYAQFPFRLETHYRAMFTHMLEHDAAIAIHCAAGKDRTGMAAALILSALGVDRDTILEDYALTELYYRPEIKPGGAKLANQIGFEVDDLALEIERVFAGADPRVLSHALALIDERHGGPLELIREAYGVGPEEVAQLRARYLAPAAAR